MGVLGYCASDAKVSRSLYDRGSNAFDNSVEYGIICVQEVTGLTEGRL